MTDSKSTNEQRYFDALKRITLYQSLNRLNCRCWKDWGLSYLEALEMAYENMQQDAKRAIGARRRP